MTLSLLDAVQAKLTDQLMTAALNAYRWAEQRSLRRYNIVPDTRPDDALGIDALRAVLIPAILPLLLDAEAQRQRVEEALKDVESLVIRGQGYDDIGVAVAKVRAALTTGGPSPDYQRDENNERAARANAADAALRTIRIKRTPPPKGLCGARPKLDGSQGNPMAMCNLKAKHKGKHSWEGGPEHG